MSSANGAKTDQTVRFFGGGSISKVGTVLTNSSSRFGKIGIGAHWDTLGRLQWPSCRAHCDTHSQVGPLIHRCSIQGNPRPHKKEFWLPVTQTFVWVMRLRGGNTQQKGQTMDYRCKYCGVNFSGAGPQTIRTHFQVFSIQVAYLVTETLPTRDPCRKATPAMREEIRQRPRRGWERGG